MSIKAKKILISFLCLFTLLMGICAFLFKNNYSSADTSKTAEISVSDFISKEYALGEKVVLPNVYINGAEAYRTVTSPSGKCYGSSDLVLDESGNWALSYVLNDYHETFCFKVSVPIFTTSGNKSKVYVGKVSDYTPYNAEGKSGIISKIAVNEQVTYNKPIDLNDNKKEDTLLSLSVLPEVVGTCDALNLYVKFTDIWNPDNYVKIAIKKVPLEGEWYKHAVYVVCGATGQEGMGLEVVSQTYISYDGIDNYVLHKGYDYFWGTCAMNFSMTGVMGAEGIGGQNLIISCDYEARRFYVNGGLIMDLDEPQFETILWEGFKTGECLVSFYAEGYNSSAFNLLVNNIDGQDRFVKSTVENNNGPTFVSNDYDLDKVEYLIVNNPITIPSVSAYDICGNQLKVDTKVYTAYGTSNEANVQLKNNTFTPNQERDYYIVYSATDMWGNTEYDVHKIEAKSTDDKISLSLTSQESTSVVGNKYTVLCTTPDNFMGKYSVSVSAIAPDNSEQKIGSYSIGDTTEALYFTPMSVGQWTIRYKLSDVFYNNVVVDFPLTVQGGPAIFYDEAVVPNFIIKGATYDINDLYGYSFDTGIGVKSKADLYITNDGNIATASKYTAKTFSTQTGSDYVFFTYALKGQTKTYKVRVLDVSYNSRNAKAENYFYGYSSVSLQKTGFLYGVPANGDGNYQLEFINAVQAYSFAMNFSIPTGAQYKKVSICLTDADDKDNQLKISYFTDGEKTYYSINDGFSYTTDKAFNNATAKITYSAKTKKVFVNSVENLVKTNTQNKEWQGFKNNKVWVKVVLEEIEGANTSIVMEKINNQNFYKYTNFRNVDESPEIYQDNISGIKQIGSTINLPKFVVGDVFITKCNVVLTVTTPNGSYMTATNGVVLNGNEDSSESYSFIVNTYGSYVVKYYVEDEAGNINDLMEYKINVFDVDAPNVSIAEHQTKYKLNDVIQIAQINVNDDLSSASNCKVSVYVEKPNQTLFAIDMTNSSGIKFDMTGEYNIWYYVSDEAGNVTICNYFVLVFE